MGKIPFVEQVLFSILKLKNFVTSLYTPLIGSIIELEETKTDKAVSTPVIIQESGWKIPDPEKDSVTTPAAYPYYLDIEVEGVTNFDRATVTIKADSLAEATACGLCPTCETLNGVIRLWAAGKATANIAAEYWIEQGDDTPATSEERKE